MKSVVPGGEISFAAGEVRCNSDGANRILPTWNPSSGD